MPTARLVRPRRLRQAQAPPPDHAHAQSGTYLNMFWCEAMWEFGSIATAIVIALLIFRPRSPDALALAVLTLKSMRGANHDSFKEQLETG